MRRAVRRLARTGPGRRLVESLVIEEPGIALAAIGLRLSTMASLPPAAGWPEQLRGFEDVAPLVLSSNAANRGFAAMRLDEAALLWRLAQDAKGAIVVEIGRERGGSTLLLAAALAGNGVLRSYDPHTKPGAADPDRVLRSAPERYELAGHVRLHLADSHVADVPEGELALVLVDGDPSYEGTRLDFERFCRRLRPGGHALFHDAAPGGGRHPQLAPLMEEIAARGEFVRGRDVGSFVHFLRR